MSKYTIGEVYKVTPLDVVFNDEYVGFNPLHKDLEYEGTKVSIEEIGQLKPIYMLDGKCIDGRHRTRICKELGVQVDAIDVSTTLDKASVFDLCNVDTMAGRNLTPTQRAIVAMDYKDRLGVEQGTAAKKFQVTRYGVMYASKLKNVYGMSEVTDALLKGDAVQLSNMDKPSKSLEYLCKKAKELHEALVIVIDEPERIPFNPDAVITTELGKSWYYDKVHRLSIPNYDVEMRMDYVELANLKFKLE